jgi:hypothetical protein
MIFPTGQYHGHDVILAMLAATLWPIQRQGSIPMPWAISPWLDLVKFIGLATKKHGKTLILTRSIFCSTVTFRKKLGFNNNGSFAPQNEGQA